MFDNFLPTGNIGMWFMEKLIRVFCLLICLTVHEFSHGYVAYKLGDDTAKLSGRLTLNPLPHIDIVGALCMLLTPFGWAKPVPVNPRNFTRKVTMRTGMAITAVAGPLSNLILSFFSMLIFVTLVNFNFIAGLQPSIQNALKLIFQNLIFLNIGLALFNLIPIPPLDGSKILGAFLSSKAFYKYIQIERYGFVILILIINTPLVNQILYSALLGIVTLYTNIISLVPIFREAVRLIFR